MRKMTPAEYREKQATRLKGAIEEMEKGVDAVTESPTHKAAAKIDKMEANFVKAIRSGKTKRGLMRVDAATWKDKMKKKGIPRVATGIDEAADKVEAFAAEFLPHVYAGAEAVAKMPDISTEDSCNRAAAMIRHNAKFVRKG